MASPKTVAATANGFPNEANFDIRAPALPIEGDSLGSGNEATMGRVKPA
ncbi:MAG: hypothetical protein ACOVOT_17090 [Rubrivivax sp.]|jgi:hypothetical protein|nr:hypothetical protein [Rubrivivax sp.]